MKPGDGVRLLTDLPIVGPFRIAAGTEGIILYAYPTWARVVFQGHGECPHNVDLHYLERATLYARKVRGPNKVKRTTPGRDPA